MQAAAEVKPASPSKGFMWVAEVTECIVKKSLHRSAPKTSSWAKVKDRRTLFSRLLKTWFKPPVGSKPSEPQFVAFYIWPLLLSTFQFICDTEKWICHASLTDRNWWREGFRMSSSVRRCESQLVRSSIAYRQSAQERNQCSCLVKKRRLWTFCHVEEVVLNRSRTVCNAVFCFQAGQRWSPGAQLPFIFYYG